MSARDLAGALAEAARTTPGAVAAWVPAGRSGFRATTYAGLDARADALAAGLSAYGIGPGTRTAMLVPPGEDFFALAFGLLRAGAVPVLVDPGIGTANLGRCLGEVRPEAFVGIPRAQVARRALRWCPTVRRSVTVGRRVPGGGATLAEVEAEGVRRLPFAPPPAQDPAAVLFTTGSTGVPKGVEYRHPQFLAQVALLRELWGLGPGDVSLATFPPFALFGPLLGISTIVPRMDPTRPADVDPRQVLAAAEHAGATVMFGSPALLDTVSRWGAETGKRFPASLTRVVSAGSPVTPEVQRRTLAMLPDGAQVHSPYGATEALPVTDVGSDEVLRLRRSGAVGICVGRPVPGVDLAVVRVVDGELPALRAEDLLPAGQVGEVVVRGPNVTERYAERPVQTALAKTRWDGRLAHRMGDAGWLDDEGRLWFAGRAAHRVRAAGGTLWPVPVEVRLDAHPAVRRSALVGVGEPGAQRPVAVLELEPGHRASDALAREVLDLAASSPVTERVRTVLFYGKRFPVDIRHNAKIDRPALARWAAGRLR
ncbi:fatty acid CoA ligase family protein [Vallicoccus soli]|uniref:fatty acid CoA ligase family protein n=1 Tax=Vallicoccus soli TaxID=2339232 RepID=UPI0014025668|nr:fatty acid CoA ligase family protein [Vallicoccus soli]